MLHDYARHFMSDARGRRRSGGAGVGQKRSATLESDLEGDAREQRKAARETQREKSGAQVALAAAERRAKEAEAHAKALEEENRNLKSKLAHEGAKYAEVTADLKKAHAHVIDFHKENAKQKFAATSNYDGNIVALLDTAGPGRADLLRHFGGHLRSGIIQDINDNDLTAATREGVVQYTDASFNEARRSGSGVDLQYLIEGILEKTRARDESSNAGITAAVYGAVDRHFVWDLALAREIAFRPRLESRQLNDVDNLIIPGGKSHSWVTRLFNHVSMLQDGMRRPRRLPGGSNAAWTLDNTGNCGGKAKKQVRVSAAGYHGSVVVCTGTGSRWMTEKDTPIIQKDVSMIPGGSTWRNWSSVNRDGWKLSPEEEELLGQQVASASVTATRGGTRAGAPPAAVGAATYKCTGRCTVGREQPDRRRGGGGVRGASTDDAPSSSMYPRWRARRRRRCHRRR